MYLEFTYDSYIDDIVVLTDHKGYMKVDAYAACSRVCDAVFRLFDAEEMVKQHRNRPSVIMYSVMNEPPTDLDECAELARKLVEHIKKLKKLDPSRPVTLASY